MTETSMNNASWLRKAVMLFTLLAVVTAPFDELLALELNGLSFRLSQLFIAVACLGLLVLWITQRELRLPFGWHVFAFLLVLNLGLCFVTKSESLVYQLGYEAWFALDIALTVLCVGAFQTQEGKDFLLRVYLMAFVVMAAVCMFQLVTGLFGFEFYVDQYMGYLPRCDAFLSEPSYYACFALPGWVFFSYMIEMGETAMFTPAWYKRIWGLLTMAVVFSTSRMGFLMIGAWLAFRLINTFLTGERKKERRRAVLFLIAGTLLAVLLLVILFNVVSMIGFFGRITDVSGSDTPRFFGRITDVSGSDTPRIEGMIATLHAFWKNHLLVGSSLGGAYAEVMLLAPDNVWQVSNLFAELAVSLGLPGLAALAIYMVGIIRKSCAVKGSPVVMALLWGLLWQLGILQFNNNGLRIYLWVNIALLGVYLPVKRIRFGKE